MSEDQALQVITPAMTEVQFKSQHNQIARFVKNQLREAKDIRKGGDYGIIPGTTRKSLLKPGAEKLLKMFGLSADPQPVKEVEDFANNFVFYKYKVIITHIATGTFIASATRSCNNKEKKFAGQSAYECANNVEARAQKRALVAATVQACMASEIFDADISSEDDDEAPNKPVTQEEDPHRVQLISRLHGTANQHGWNNIWIHKAIKQKWGFESLTNCSNNQIEELTEFILEKYEVVEKGKAPKLKEQVLSSNESQLSSDMSSEKKELSSQEPSTTPVNKEPEVKIRTCPNPDNNPDCQRTLPDDYERDACSSCRMKEFMKTGKISKGLPKAEKKDTASETSEGSVQTGPIASA